MLHLTSLLESRGQVPFCGWDSSRVQPQNEWKGVEKPTKENRLVSVRTTLREGARELDFPIRGQGRPKEAFANLIRDLVRHEVDSKDRFKHSLRG